MIRRRSGSWVYLVLNREVWDEIGPAPQERTDDTEMIKVNPVRAVFRRGDCFYKLEMPAVRNIFAFWRAIFWAKAKREFFTLRMLQRRGLPVTPPLAAGQAATVSMLVTRAVPGAVAVSAYMTEHFVRQGRDPKEFLRHWSDFIRLFARSGFYHPDFHNGNILYSEVDSSFHLVDVYGVRYAWLGKRSKRRRMYRILHEMREFLNRDELIELAVAGGAAANREEGERFYLELLRVSAAHTAKEWRKRRRQYLENYPKFVEVREFNGRELILPLDGARKPFCEPEQLERGGFEIVTGSPEELEQLRLRDFELAMHLIPHLRIAAYDPANGRIYREKAIGPADAEAGAYLSERLKLAGLSPASEFVRDAHNRVVVGR